MKNKQKEEIEVTERKMGPDEQAMLEQAEKMMDEGVMPYVILEGKRIMFAQETLDQFDIRSGDVIDFATMGKLQKFQMQMFYSHPE